MEIADLAESMYPSAVTAIMMTELWFRTFMSYSMHERIHAIKQKINPITP